MQSVFEANPNISKLIVFEDGNCFLMQDRNLAELHKKQTGLEYTIVAKEEEKQPEIKTKKTNK